MKKSQLKEAIKAVVRECLNERVEEGCGGNKRFKGKAARMFKHVEDSEKKQGKSTKVAKRIAGATVNKNLKNEQVGADVVADEGSATDNKQTSIDDIVKFVIRKVPSITDNPQKISRVAGLLFKHNTGEQPPEPETLLKIVQKHLSGNHESNNVGMEEAGLTSEDGCEEHGYDENEEIMLIKVMALIAKKLEAMHAGSNSSDEPSSIMVGAGEEEPLDGPVPFGTEDSDFPAEPEEPPQEEEPEENPEPEEPSEPKGDDKGEEDNGEEEPVKEAAYKQVSPRASTDAKEDKARRIQTVPKVNETSVRMRMGPQYKTVAPRQARVTSDDQARTIQFDPKMTEAKKKMKENHRVQTRSHVTVKDNPNDPNVMRDPENPQSNGA